MKAEDWIKVTDRLPKAGEFVLVLHSDGDLFQAMRDINGIIWFATGYTVPVLMTTHWMPLVLPNEE